MSGKHTPGTWFWEFCGTSGQWALRAGPGFVEVGGPPSQKPSADMRLIASAPDLLAVVRELVAISGSDDWNGSGRLDDALSDAREILARIGGAQ